MKNLRIGYAKTLGTRRDVMYQGAKWGWKSLHHPDG